MIDLDQGGKGLAWAEFFAPPSDLDPWVEHLWIQRYPRSVEGESWLVVPDASAHILVHDQGGGLTPRIVGARSTAARFRLGQRRWSVGVRLRPGALLALDTGSAADLLDRSTPLAEFLDTRPLDRVMQAEPSDPREVVRAVTRLLSAHLSDRPHPDWRVRALLRSAAQPGGSPRVSTVARELGISERGLRAVLTRWVGMSPKTVLRIRRVQRAASDLLSAASPSPARVALQVGYADQPHLARDFGALMGESPTAFLRRADADFFKPDRGAADILRG